MSRDAAEIKVPAIFFALFDAATRGEVLKARLRIGA